MAVTWPQDGYHNALEPFDEQRFEYATTEGPRKGEVPPPAGHGWEEIDWVRGDHTDEALWRRPRLQSSGAEDIEKSVRIHIALVGLVLKRVFDADPAPVMQALRDGFAAEPPNVRRWLPHASPYDLAVDWSDSPNVVDNAEAQNRYLRLCQTAEWLAVAAGGSASAQSGEAAACPRP